MKTTLFSLILATTLTGCTWFDSLKPKETFFCKVNGEPFRPDKDDSPIGGVGSDPLRVQFDKENGWLSILVRKSPNSMTLIVKVTPNETLKLQDFIFTNDIKLSKAYYNLNYAEQNAEALISESGTFKIEKIDGYNLSGTFAFTCKSAKTGKVYEITEGQFNDISYY